MLLLRRYIVLILLGILTIPDAGGQKPARAVSPSVQDTTEAFIAWARARAMYRRGSQDTALDLASESLQMAMTAGDTATQIRSLKLIAAVILEQGQPADAIPYYLRAVNIMETGEDTAALHEVYAEIARCYHLEGIDEKEAEYYLKALQILPAGMPGEQTTYTRRAGLALLNQNKTDSAAMFFNRLRILLNKAGKDDTPAVYHLVQTYNQAEEYEKALDYNRILFERVREKQDYGKMSSLKNNMAYNLTLMGEYEQASRSFTEAIEYGEKAGAGNRELALMMTNAAICHQNMNQEEKAKQMFRSALSRLHRSENPEKRARIENMLALIYYREGDLYNAGLFSLHSIESAKQANDAARLAENYLTYSRILREGNDPVRALDHYEKHLALRDSLQLEKRLEENALARKKFQLERSEKELKLKLKEEQVKELVIQQLTLQLQKEEQEKELLKKEKDVQQLEKERLRQSLVITRQQHAVEQQERENRILEQEKRIADLRLEQQERKQKEQEQEIRLLEQQKQLDRLELARQKTARKAMSWIIASVILIALLILGGLIVTRKKNILLARQKKEIQEKNEDLESKNEEISAQRDEIEAQRDLLMEQKQEIEQYNLEIRQSIEYAKRIQTSILPDISSLQTTLSDHFVLFRPRDIVSGDFYWTSSVENTTVITVSDCTGHGVPGAFMSMLGMSLLKEIILKEYITHPGVILRRLRKEVVSALGQKGISGEQRDGMDMALIALDHNAGKLAYAGAFNSLYFIRGKKLPAPENGEVILFEPENDTGYYLYEIKGDKMPIGFHTKMDRFSTHEIEIMKGDSIYLFTDGYADQFGGPKGKKFKYKPFKRLLLQNAHLSMKEQSRILGETLDRWMGDIQQVDDICVMGIKI